MHQYTVLVFIFLAYFTLYNGLRFHLIVVLIYMTLMTNGMEPLFICSHGIELVSETSLLSGKPSRPKPLHSAFRNLVNFWWISSHPLL